MRFLSTSSIARKVNQNSAFQTSSNLRSMSGGYDSKAPKTFIKFAIVGASGVLVNLGFFTLLLDDGHKQVHRLTDCDRIVYYLEFSVKQLLDISMTQNWQSHPHSGFKVQSGFDYCSRGELRVVCYPVACFSGYHATNPSAHRHSPRHSGKLFFEFLLDLQARR